MYMRLKLLALAASTLIIAACGGGGSGGAFTPPAATFVVTVAAGQTTTTPKSLVDVLVSVRRSTGEAVTDGTSVTLQVSPPGVGLVSFISSGNVVIGDRALATTAGGTANFRFHSKTIGTAVLTASVNDPNSTGAAVTASTNVAVVAGPASDPRLQMVATTTTLPTNTFGVAPFLGSPFLSEVIITWRRLDGTLVNTGDKVNVSINPVINTAGFSTPDDPATADINEFLLHIAQAPVNNVAGKSTVFMQALDIPSTSVMTVTANDPNTNETLEAALTFTVVNGAPQLPGSLTLTRSANALYIQGSGGRTADQLQVAIKDGAGGPVPDPVGNGVAFNNLQMELLGGSLGGDRLRTVNAQGATVQGNLITARSINGQAQVTYETGTQTRIVQVRATSDRADNNVDNGITDPVTAVMSITVSDGRLYELELTIPVVDAIVTNNSAISLDPAAPPSANGTYSLTVSAEAIDSLGNPVIPGTEIRFGSIDGPLQNNFFAISGLTGNPQEGGTSFADPNGLFTTQGGGAGPSDTLLVFGEEITGNRDLESARRVQSVNGATSITVQRRFNFNDTTGVTVDSGAILPYVIGRPEDGSIRAVAFTDASGVASTQLTYPAGDLGKLGKLAAIHAEGNGDIVAGTPELITDAEFVRFAGIAPGQLVAFPSSIPGNKTVSVDVCYFDAQDNPISGSFVAFSFTNLNGGIGRVDGVQTSGVTTSPTGSDGCVTVSVQTLGMVPSAAGPGTEPTVTFSVGAATAPVTIVTGTVLLAASPSTVTGDGGRLIQLTLTSADGSPIQSAIITGTCTSSGGTLSITTAPAPTSASGTTTAIVTASGFDVTTASGPTGSCIFSAGTATATVNWNSRNICGSSDGVGFSPPPPGCPSSTVNLTIFGVGSSTSSPSGLLCTGPTLGACSATFAPGTQVLVQLNVPPTSWGGDCAAFGTAQAATISLPPLPTTVNCTVVFP